MNSQGENGLPQYRRPELFEVDERLTLLYITLYIIALWLKEKEESWKK
jgi:hypothetical protein